MQAGYLLSKHKMTIRSKTLGGPFSAVSAQRCPPSQNAYKGPPNGDL